MAYQTDLSNWGATGTEPPANYSYEEGEQPVDAWDNWFNSTVISELTDVIDLINDIDNDTDGVVDDSDQFSGTAPSDGTNGQFLQTDGSTTLWQGLAFVQSTRPTVDGSGRTWIRTRETNSISYSTDTVSNTTAAEIAIHGNVLYVAFDDTNEVGAYDYLTGNEIWRHSLHSNSVHCVDSNGSYIASGDSFGNVYVANASDGSQVSTHQHHGGGNIVFDVRLGAGTVYSGGQDNNVYAAAISDGSQQWSHSQHAGSVRTLELEGRHLYSASDADGENIVRVNIDNGSLDRTISSPRSGEGITEILLADEILYVTYGPSANQGASSGRVYAFDIGLDGAGGTVELWNVEPGFGGGADEITYEDGKIYTNVGGSLYVIDVETAEEETLVPQAEFVSGQEVHRGMVYIGLNEEGRAIGWPAEPAKFISNGSEWLFDSLLQ